MGLPSTVIRSIYRLCYGFWMYMWSDYSRRAKEKKNTLEDDDSASLQPAEENMQTRSKPRLAGRARERAPEVPISPPSLVMRGYQGWVVRHRKARLRTRVLQNPVRSLEAGWSGTELEN